MVFGEVRDVSESQDIVSPIRHLLSTRRYSRNAAENGVLHKHIYVYYFQRDFQITEFLIDPEFKTLGPLLCNMIGAPRINVMAADKISVRQAVPCGKAGDHLSRVDSNADSPVGEC